jgi:crotonobetainyl-CoA:carnitine CoA-transferase CaiB-like acyl-CoA transferase
VVTQRDDQSALEVTGEASEFSRLAGFLASSLGLSVVTQREATFSGGFAATAQWAASGAMWLTGHPSGPPLAPRAAVVPALRAASRIAAGLAAGAADGRGLDVDLGELLTGRAAWMGLRRGGRTSANGSCRLLRAEDGWVAVNLARASDVDAVPAMIERPVTGDPWDALTAAMAGMPAAAVVERATLVAVPAGALPSSPTDVGSMPLPPGPFRVSGLGEAREPAVAGRRRAPLVVDLSAMWAGPLCAHLLGRAGFRVVKVESPTRPDGARSGEPRFFSWLHGGHESVALDLSSEGGRRSLGELLDRADVVVESSRPRALGQLGIDAEQVVAARPGVTWVGITGHGRSAGSSRVAFGDDAAVAAGLVAWDERDEPVFCGDAIADPVTGLYAAVGALASQAAGGGHLLDVAMVDATRFAATPAVPVPAVPATPGRWEVPADGGGPPQPVVQPTPPPPPPVPARPLGADTARVLAELAPTGGRPC